MEQGLHQRCVLATLLFRIFFVALVNVAYMSFKAHKDIMDALVHMTKQKGRGKATVREPVLATPLWGIVYANDIGAVSQSPEQPRKIIVAGRTQFQNTDRKVDYSDQ